MTHTSGLKPVVPRDFEWEGYETGIKLACAEPLMSYPGTEWRYSDINFILLGEIIRRASGIGLEELSKQRVFCPVGHEGHGAFSHLREKACAGLHQQPSWKMASHFEESCTIPSRDAWEEQRGHAGLFTTAADLAKFARMMLANGALPNGTRLFRSETVAAMTRVQTAGHIAARRGLGWDIDSPYAGPRGAFPLGSFGHTGWTGTSMWIDPFSQSFLILVSNRNHPSEKGNVLQLRRDLANLIPDAIPHYDFSAVPGALDPVDKEEPSLRH